MMHGADGTPSGNSETHSSLISHHGMTVVDVDSWWSAVGGPHSPHSSGGCVHCASEWLAAHVQAAGSSMGRIPISSPQTGDSSRLSRHRRFTQCADEITKSLLDSHLPVLYVSHRLQPSES